MQKNLFFFYKCSHGELHAGLPFFLKVLDERKEIAPYFICNSQDDFDRLPSYYKKIIANSFKIIVLNKKNFISFFVKYVFNKNYIFSCDNGHTTYTRFLACYWPFSRVAFFAHAYALNSDNLDSTVEKKFKLYKRRYTGSHHEPLIVAHNSKELKYRKALGFHEDNIVVAGNIGYEESWFNIYAEAASEDVDKISKLKVKYSKIIFVPTRDAHSIYLSEENSRYLLYGLASMLEHNIDYLFLIKLHPRQENYELFKELKNNYNNVEFINLNTQVAAKISDLVVSYWSSAITDSLAANTPAIEFHRHEVFHEQLIKTENGLVSLYHHYGLCPFYQNKEDILNLLKDPASWDGIRDKQQLKFKEIYLHDYPDFVDNLFERFEKTSFRAEWFFDTVKIPLVSIRKLIVSFLGFKRKVKA